MRYPVRILQIGYKTSSQNGKHFLNSEFNPSQTHDYETPRENQIICYHLITVISAILAGLLNPLITKKNENFLEEIIIKINIL